MKIEIEIDRDEVIERAAKLAYDEVRGTVTRYDYDVGEEYEDTSDNRVARAIHKAVKELIAEQAPRLIADTLRPKVEELCVSGWNKTNSYGEPIGSETLTSYVRGQLTLKGETSNFRSDQSIATQVLKQSIDEFLSKEMNAEVAEFRKAMRAKLNDVLQGKITEAMREAVGLR